MIIPNILIKNYFNIKNYTNIMNKKLFSDNNNDEIPVNNNDITLVNNME
jgi:hypothetical protein